MYRGVSESSVDKTYIKEHDVDVDVEWMYELRQSPLCPPQTYDLHSNDTIKFLVYYSTALRLPVPSNCALKS